MRKMRQRPLNLLFAHHAQFRSVLLKWQGNPVSDRVALLTPTPENKSELNHYVIEGDSSLFAPCTGCLIQIYRFILHYYEPVNLDETPCIIFDSASIDSSCYNL